MPVACTWSGPASTSSAAPPAAPVRCDDPALEPHHLLIEVSADGLMLRQLTGRVPLRSDGEAIDDSSMITSTVTVEIGHSLLTACPTDLTAPGHGRICSSSATRRTSPRRLPATCWCAAAGGRGVGLHSRSTRR